MAPSSRAARGGVKDADARLVGPDVSPRALTGPRRLAERVAMRRRSAIVLALPRASAATAALVAILAATAAVVAPPARGQSPGPPTPPPVIAPGDNLVTEGIPPIPAEIAYAVNRYAEFRFAAFLDWHPVRREMLIT